jgi:hypothetical protein
MAHGSFSRRLVLNLFKMFSNKIVWTMDSETVSRWAGSIFHIVTLSVTAFYAKHELTREQILVYSQSTTGTNQTADQQKFVIFILR